MTNAEATAATLARSHVGLVTAVPGHGATGTYEAWQALQRSPGDAAGGDAPEAGEAPPFSFHEEVAFGMAHGAALRGTRAAVLVKAHGFLKAANAVADSLAVGTTAGLEVVVFHDPTGSHSDSILEVEGVARELGMPVHRADPVAAPSSVARVMRASERQGLPHLLILPADPMDRSASEGPDSLEAPTVRYERDPARHLCSPLFADYQHRVFEARKKRRDPETVERPQIPRVPDDLPDAYRSLAETYVPLFEALAETPRAVTSGDTTVGSLFACPPVEAVDLCTYMGGSVPLALGAGAVGNEPAWAVTGDFGLVAAGHLGLLEARQRGLPLKVLVLDNGRAHATGGQPVTADAVDAVLAGYRDAVVPLDAPTDSAACRAALDRAAQANGLAIVRADFRSS